MSNITTVAKQFFEACETGKGWEGCRAYCTPDASFSAQAEPLAEIRTLQGYADWMKGLLSLMPDGRYAVKSFATDDDRNSVCAYGVFSATHTGQGGPCPPTGKSTTTDYVYVMDFAGDKIRHMTKVYVAEVDGDLLAVAGFGSKLSDSVGHFLHPYTIHLDGI